MSKTMKSPSTSQVLSRLSKTNIIPRPVSYCARTQAMMPKNAEILGRFPTKALLTFDQINQTGRETSKVPLLAGETLRVLVVDNCRDTVDSMSTLVEMWGYHVLRAYDGISALQLASSLCPHVVLTDTDLAWTEANGLPLAKQFRQLPGMEDALLVALTGWTGEKHSEASIRAGFDQLYIKPVNPDIIFTLLSDHQGRLNSATMHSLQEEPAAPRSIPRCTVKTHARPMSFKFSKILRHPRVVSSIPST